MGGVKIKPYILFATNILFMLDAQQITLRFLRPNCRCIPMLFAISRNRMSSKILIERIIAQVPGETIVVSAKHIPGMNATRDGTRFLTDPSVEVISGSPGTSGCVNGTSDYLHYFRDRYNRLGDMIRWRCGAMPIEALNPEIPVIVRKNVLSLVWLSRLRRRQTVTALSR